MADIFDYLAWRGDLPLTQDGLNEVDGAVLAQFAYIPFECFADPLPDCFISVRDMAANALGDVQLKDNQRWKQSDDRLLTTMAKSARFGNLGVAFLTSRLDEQVQTQFSAITVRLDTEHYFIAFRGTDDTLIGWKEDLNMSYLCPIPAQQMAVEYVRHVADLVDGRIILGGHSKGGNLAIFAGAFCGKEIQEQIDAVYNYDGPGFFDDILQTDGYQRICTRIHTYIPQFSVVGMLLNHQEECTVVHSTETGIMQHDIYSWEMIGPKFVSLDTVTDGSRFLNSTIKEWIKKMTPEQFEVFTNTIFDVLLQTNAHTFQEMRENWFDASRSIVRSMGGTDENTRAAVMEVMRMLVRSAGKEVKEAVGITADITARRMQPPVKG